MFKPLLLISALTLTGLISPDFWDSLVQDAAAGQATAPAATTEKNPVKPTAESQAKAKKIYGYDCALCHGDNGNGKTDLAKDMQLTLTDWTDPKTLEGKSDGELFDIIKNGKGKMPAEDASRAKPDEIWNLVIYVRKLGKTPGA